MGAEMSPDRISGSAESALGGLSASARSCSSSVRAMLWGGIACPLAQLGAPTWYGANREILRKVSDDTPARPMDSV